MTIYAKAPFKHVTEFNNSTVAELFATPEFTAAVNAIAGGGGLEGTSYIYVAANGTDIENAAELQTAYTTAQGMSPSASNYVTIIAAPGNYNFQSTPFVMNTQYINLVSLDGNRSIIFNSSDSNGNLNVTADNVFVKGINLQTKSFTVGSLLSNLKVENCKSGSNSFYSSNISFVLSGTYTNCEVGDDSFYANQISGTYDGCITGNYGFVGYITGILKNCTVQSYSIGLGFSNVASCAGTFINCTGFDYCFKSTCSGLFIGCRTNDYGFAWYDSCTGNFYNCIGRNQCFSYGPSAYGAFGLFVNCVINTGGFGHDSTASGSFANCIADANAFGYKGACSGKFYNCIVMSGTGFGTGSGGTLTGKLYYCRVGFDPFRTVSGGGKTRYCIDGNDTANNQG
jgi:hypothetical protein